MVEVGDALPAPTSPLEEGSVAPLGGGEGGGAGCCPPTSELVVESAPHCGLEQTRLETLKHWATRSSVHSFARTAHSGQLASLALSAAITRPLARSLVCSLAHFTHSLTRGRVNF